MVGSTVPFYLSICSISAGRFNHFISAADFGGRQLSNRCSNYISTLWPLGNLNRSLSSIYLLAIFMALIGVSAGVQNISQIGTPDEAVFLPGRNAVLAIKAALWCQLHGIDELAIATLRSNPFDDASAQFLEQLGKVLSGTRTRPIRLVRPFGEFGKQQVMELGRAFPLELTFSCIAPRKMLHCGRCNKCAERQAAFRLIGGERSRKTYACFAVRRFTGTSETANYLQVAKQ